jgi:hypothetical protein
MNNILSKLPKPVRFGLFGALGGLFGALLLGELLWWMLEPPAPPPPGPPPPRLAVSVSPEVGVFQDGKNKFALDFESDRLDGAAVSVTFSGQPTGIVLNGLAGAERESREAEVMASGSAPLGSHKVRAVATAKVDGETITATNEFSVRVDPVPVPVVDIMFALDTTSSMQPFINGVRDGIADFVSVLAKQRIDARIGLLAYKDRKDQDAELLLFGSEPFTTDVSAFREKVSRLRAFSGPRNNDAPESTSDALVQVAKLSFRPKATKVVLLVTDAPPLEPDKDTATLADAVDVLKSHRIDQVHLVVRNDDLSNFRALRTAYPNGSYIDLMKVRSGRSTFASILPELSKVIATAAAAARPTDAQLSAPPPKPSLGAAQGLQSSREYDSSSTGRLVAAISIWTAAIAAAISLALGIGQFLSLNRKPSPGAIALVLAGGAVAGLVGGAVGQGLFALASGSSVLGVILRVVGWSALGGLAGSGLAFVVPNLRKAHGLVGGLLGGGLGAVGYLIASGIGLGDTLGRLAGALILGFFIGLMVALVEAALRRAWLEVRFGGGETITVNLGPEPVKVGGDGKQCAVWARGADPVALRYWVREGKVVCDESGSGEQTVGNGDRRTAGSVEVVVRMASGGPVTERPRSEAPPRAKPAAEPVPPKPMSAPVAKPAPRPAPVPPKPMSAPVAKPAPRPVSGPTCPECGAAVDKTHGVCPACGAMY